MTIRKKVWIWLKLVLCVGMCFYMLTFSIFFIHIYLMPEADLVYDDSSVVVVFGCRTYGMTPGRTLSSRLECAYKILENNTSMMCVVSGGKGPNETVTEAESMRVYLINRGIEPERIYIEDKSHNTIENIEYTLNLLDANNLCESTIIGVSSIYHLPRIRMLAENFNLSIITVPANTSNIFLSFSDTVREYMAWVKAILLNNI
ncbi:MAG: YdcF family protein [Eubacteriales bacterium]